MASNVHSNDEALATEAMPHPVLGPLRAFFRLTMMLTQTAYFGGRLALESALLGVDAQRSAHFTSRWSRALLRSLGVEQYTHGTCPPEATILVGNHRSYIDIPLIAALEPCTFLAKQEVADWPLIGRCARAAGTVFVRRGDKHSRHLAREALQRRAERAETVVVFPEGTTYAGPALLPMKIGAFRVANDADVALAPVAIVYQDRCAAYVDDDRLLEHFCGLFQRRRVIAHISFGPVVRGQTPQQLHSAATAWLQTEIRRLEQLP